MTKLKPIGVVFILALSSCTTMTASYRFQLTAAQRVREADAPEPLTPSAFAPAPTDTVGFEDDTLKVVFANWSFPPLLRIENKSQYALRILWDESAIQNPKGRSHRVVHEGIRPIERDRPQPPSVIPPRAYLVDHVAPLDLMETTTSAEHVHWMLTPALPAQSSPTESSAEFAQTLRQEVGRKLVVLLTVLAGPRRIEYSFVLQVASATVRGEKSAPGQTPEGPPRYQPPQQSYQPPH